VVALNAGLSGAPPMAQLAWVRRFVGKPKRPRLVVMSISPYMFSSKIARPLSRESLHTMYRVRDLPAVVRAGGGGEEIGTVLANDLFGAVRVRPRLMDILWRDGKWTRVREISEPRVFLLGEPVSPATQNDRARGRGLAYRTEMWPPATFGNEQMGYFVEALRELSAARVPVAVMNTHSASQIELAYGPQSLYDQHIRWVHQQAARFHAPYFDAKGSPAISDADFVDGDHLGADGARRFSAWLAHRLVIPLLGGPPVDRPAGCRGLFDFESGLEGWQVEGTMPRAAQAVRTQTPVIGYQGGWFMNTFGPHGDGDTGRAVSPPFVLDGHSVRLRVGGGAGPQVGVALVVDGARVAEARGRDRERLADVVWDVRAWAGKTAALEAWDQARGAWGHLLLDDVTQCP
jgi:hypothetical protein